MPACQIVGISVRTYERWLEAGKIKEDQRALTKRKPPANKLSEIEYQAVLNTVKQPQFADLPPSQIVPTLADKGVYIASESTFYRILRKEHYNHHRGRAKKAEKAKLPTTHIARRPNEVWSWDITFLSSYTRGRYFKLYLIMDIFSRKIVAWEVWEEEKGELASILIERAALSEKIGRKPLILHSDNGGPMKSYTLKAKLEELGIFSSYSRPRVSNDNPYSESIFRTCKYRPGYPTEGFESIETARNWVLSFVDWYNNRHYHSSLNFLTPATMHKGQAKKIMAKRKMVYQNAKILHPLRFNRGIRKWDFPQAVALNPTDEIKSLLFYENSSY